MVTLLAENLLGPMDIVTELNELADFNPDQSLPRAAACMTWLDQINPKEVLFFTPVEIQSEDDNDVNDKNDY
jgi:hypothetical protein